jgi:serine/threonine-protein kinase HipA
MARRDPLQVWLYGHHVAELTSSRPGEVVCRYTPEALDIWKSNTPLLSCSLPLRPQRQQAGLFFRGLLPEGRHLQAIAARANVPTFDTFGLLARYGKDVAGAAVIATDYPGERPGDVEPYSDETLRNEVAALPERPLGLHDDSELSLPGLQDKMLLIELESGRWGRPIHGRPSTHILKVEDRRFPGMAEMEAACLRLARADELTSVNVVTPVIGGIPCLIVSRFDRRNEHGTVIRIHQEDACQALNRDPDANRGRGKYESSGGPSLREIASLLEFFSPDPVSELIRLVRTVTFTLLIGNADAHGKNIGLIHVAPGDVHLAPLYDTVPTALWPPLPTTAAMTVSGRHNLATITIDDVVAEATHWRLDPETARAAAQTTAQHLLSALEQSLAPGSLIDLVTERARLILGH